MRRPPLRLAACVLAGTATALLVASAARADPAHEPARDRSEVSPTQLSAPPFATRTGRKLG